MKLIYELFSRYRVKEELLTEYGFKKEDGAFVYTSPVADGAFEFRVRVKDKKIDARLTDTDFGDEFGRIDGEGGSFVSTLKSECEKILLDIRDKCFYRENFITEQANRITSEIERIYGVTPEFLWEKFPHIGVFRNKASKKWFGIIMNVDKGKIIDGESGETEVLNVKLDGDAESALKIAGVYPAYHLNKKNWVSILLCDVLSDADIMALTAKSFEIVG